ncbi:DUF2269 domain-containing protein [Comamonas sp. JC664]|uniref:DUF2269 family protein n=1 Tax=Comamonas sp. JC664 TaxID=2801917 RepID=UPI00174B0A00|nr:DUF2269 domain-containing protein [Comamonas sp. JC664]MBL0694214.1 DUF2269 domain-containing protein [Comamonas sp. JC664]GHG76370.1 hypothetical protein GCM10012319_25440 [Comamonas sp. KCTC 72670]
MNVHNVLKLLHLVAVVVFLGDIVVTAVWRLMADRTREPRVMAYALRLVQVTDKYLLVPSVFALALTGMARAHLQGISLWAHPALAAGQVSFMLCGVVWQLTLRPIQARQLAMAESMGEADASFDEYLLLTRKWFWWGILAMALAFGSMALMTLR